MKQKRCAELHIPHYNPQTTSIWSLIELASLYTVPLSTINGLSHLWLSLTQAGTADLIRKFSNQPIPFKSNRTANSNSNLEPSQVPSVDAVFVYFPAAREGLSIT